MKKLMLQLIAIALLSIVFAQQCFALELIERRRSQFGDQFSYFIYPIAGDVPGLGTAAGIGATVLNIADSDADFSGFNVKGDFDASGYTLLNMHLVPKRLIFDIGIYDFEAASTQYKRGINSDKDDFLLPRASGDYVQAQLTYSFSNRQFETFARVLDGDVRLLEVIDENKNRFTVDNQENSVQLQTIGVSFDNTDDRLDPRKGYRLEMAVKGQNSTENLRSDFFVTDYNVTGYIPFRKWDTLALNFFRSDAHIRRRANVSKAELRAGEDGFNCQPSDSACQAAEDDFIDEIFAYNQYGNASSIGGTQRLRSFANGRYTAGHSVSWGVEYRYNITDEKTPFDFYVAKGMRTGIQLAFFAEQGSVADRTSELFDTIKSSYGVGFRLILSGVIIRADISNGNEGSEFILFIDYPWGLFSVDSS